MVAKIQQSMQEWYMFVVFFLRVKEKHLHYVIILTHLVNCKHDLE